jgi:hypothetical protein
VVDSSDASQLPSEIRERTRRFASLRAAQRALSRSVHPSELELASKRGRQILILLQELSVRSRGPAPATSALVEADLGRVDQLLDDISLRTREILAALDMANLRSSAPLLSEQHPDEVRGLVDVLLDGDVDDEKTLRMVEYLVTVLSSEDRDGRRALVREPADATPRLQEVAERLRESSHVDFLVAEKSIENTMRLLHGGGDIGDIRDRVRRYKEELGSAILHPRILPAVVAYNVAMWNHVAELIEGSRSIDHLADELLGAELPPGPQPTRAVRPEPGEDEAAGDALPRLVQALGERLRHESSADALARQLVDRFELAAVEAQERTAFGPGNQDDWARLTREAVTLGLTLRHEAQVDDLLHALDADASTLRQQGVAELSERLAAGARKLFADRRYEEAFRLSEVKTRYLAGLGAGGDGSDATAERLQRAAGRRGVLRRDWGLPAGQAWALLSLLALPVIAGLVWQSQRDVVLVSRQELVEVSPFLEAGYRRQRGDREEFVGRLNRGWDYLEPRERLRVTAEIGLAFRDLGVDSVVLEDEWRTVQARYDKGPRLEEIPALTPPQLPH